MTIHKLSDCADMPNEQFNECLKQVDMKVFMKNPAQALINAGVTVKNGVEFKFVETEEEADALPANVFPITIAKSEGSLSMEHLDKVAGGIIEFDFVSPKGTQVKGIMDKGTITEDGQVILSSDSILR